MNFIHFLHSWRYFFSLFIVHFQLNVVSCIFFIFSLFDDSSSSQKQFFVYFTFSFILSFNFSLIFEPICFSQAHILHFTYHLLHRRQPIWQKSLKCSKQLETLWYLVDSYYVFCFFFYLKITKKIRGTYHVATLLCKPKLSNEN